MRRLRDASAVLGTALLTGALLVYAVLTMRETTLRSGEELTDSLSLVIAEQTARTLQSGDQALRLAAARLDALRRAGKLDAAAGAAILQEEARHAPFIREMWVTDTQGRVLMASQPQQLGRVVAGMPPPEAWSAAPALDLHVGTVQRDASGQWQMPLVRGVRQGGAVREVLVAAVDPRYFEQLWRGIDLGATGAVVLYRRDGRLMVRSPGDEKVMGKDFSHLALFREYLPRAPEGTFTRESTLDGVRRVVAYRQLPGIPDLLVAVGTGFDELLAPWRKFAILTAAVWAAAVIAALVLVMQLRRHSRRSDETQQRFWQLAQAVPQIVFTSDPRGELEFVSQRWTEVTGYPQESALGSGWRHAVHPDDLAMMVERQAEMLRDGNEVQLEFRLRYADGSYRWQLLRALPVDVRGGGAPSWFGTATDIDTLKKAQET
jgi:PAS domain S-box-containing protein